MRVGKLALLKWRAAVGARRRRRFCGCGKPFCRGLAVIAIAGADDDGRAPGADLDLATSAMGDVRWICLRHGLFSPGLIFTSCNQSASYEQEDERKYKKIKGKKLSFPFIFFLETGLFNVLRRIQIKKSFSFRVGADCLTALPGNVTSTPELLPPQKRC